MEKKLKQEHEKMRLGCNDNGRMALATGRVTAGILAGTGIHKLSGPQLLELFQTKIKETEGDRQRVLNNRYDRDSRIYTDGITAMHKVEVFDELMKDLSKKVNPKMRKSFLNSARKEKKLMLTKDYLSLIKLKQLCLEEDQRVVVPNKIDARKLTWNIKYKTRANPLIPQKAMDYSRRRTSKDNAEVIPMMLVV